MNEIKRNKIIQGNALYVLRQMPTESVQMCVTSPPYWGLRTYGITAQVWGGDPECGHDWVTEIIKYHCDREGHRGKNLHSPDSAEYSYCRKCDAWRGDLGLEPTVAMYIKHLTEIFDEVRRVLRSDGILWLNMGDKYNTGTNGQPNGIGKKYGRTEDHHGHDRPCRAATALKRKPDPEFKRKDLIGLPWMTAFALRDAGWWFRRDIVWHKPNVMPESAKDRPHGAHEYIMLLSKSIKYYYDERAIQENASNNTHSRGGGLNPKAENWPGPTGWDRSIGKGGHNKKVGRYPQPKQNRSFSKAVSRVVKHRNKRSVWTIPCKPFFGPHYATFPPDLVRPCILAGSRPGDLVLDPFMGVGTVALVAEKLGRNWLGIELDPGAIDMAERRLALQAEQMKLAI